MNTLFIKEVTSSVMGKKLVKLNTNYVAENEYIYEININNKKLADISSYLESQKQVTAINNPKSISNIIRDIKMRIVLNKFKSDVKKIIKDNDFIGYSVIFSNELKKKMIKEYIESFLNNFSINEYLCLNTIKQNYMKYIEEYILNNNLKREKINILLVCDVTDSISIDMIESLNDEFKELSIFSKNKASKGFQNKIKKINDDTGSCIQILDKSTKDFRKYNVCIFLDKSKTEYLKQKFNKKSLDIDFTNKENDKFNKKYLKLQEGIKLNKYYSNKIKELYELYGKITTSSVIID